ncbi:hypothetical protein EG329_006723 [Mollisiaceae sp. DMI_Dod_QoI]|nr:hypothetical protein EG329_006723 [Helotiales sp. DMI_Dod_QoI]
MSQSYLNLVSFRHFPWRFTQANSTFPRFLSLPLEIRQIIWNLAIIPRIISIEDLYSTSCRHLQVPLLATCKESRELALKVYEPWGDFRAPLKIPVLPRSLYQRMEPARIVFSDLPAIPLWDDLRKQGERPFFSFCYVDFENDIFVIDDPFVIGDDSRYSDVPSSLGKSLFQYNKGERQLERVCHVVLANTLSVWMQEHQDNSLNVWVPRIPKDRLVQRTLFRFRNLKTLKIITRTSSFSSEVQLRLDSDPIHDDTKESALAYLEKLRRRRDWKGSLLFPGPWQIPDLECVEVAAEPLEGL